MNDNLIWAEKYRPKQLAATILPSTTLTDINNALINKNIQHLLFQGPAGTGKTTLAKVIALELNADLLFINASLDNSIDDIRMRVIQYASSVSFNGGSKIVLLDEFDGMSTAAQQSLRGVLEEFPNTRFIFTCNFPNKIIDAIHSRCMTVDFKIPKDEVGPLQAKFFKRALDILKDEGVVFAKDVVASLIKKNFPDFRKTLNELQRYSSGGSIDAGVLSDPLDLQFDVLIGLLKDKDFTEMRKWVGANSDISPSVLFRTFYDKASDLMDASSIPQVIIILADYDYKSTSVVDTQILVAACLTELMMETKWK